MKSRIVLVVVASAIAVLAVVFVWLILGPGVAVLHPAGSIAAQQRDLIIIGSLLSLIVVVPVFAMTFYIAWTYREGNAKARYMPDWDHSRAAETVWWLVPLALISVLGVMIVTTSHGLDPSRPIASDKRTMTVKVIALPWKWLFIYPEQGIATINQLQMPVGRPVHFEITSDAPMNSFWIPQLGGQVYAMSGMETQLYLQADQPGTFAGSSANLSGAGFAGMKFAVQAVDEAQFGDWVATVKSSSTPMDAETYARVAAPSQNEPPVSFGAVDEHLYNAVMMKYMMPGMGATQASGYAK